MFVTQEAESAVTPYNIWKIGLIGSRSSLENPAACGTEGIPKDIYHKGNDPIAFAGQKGHQIAQSLVVISQSQTRKRNCGLFIIHKAETPLSMGFQ